MKKITAMLFALIFVVLLAACGNAPGPSVETQPSAGETPPSQPETTLIPASSEAPDAEGEVITERCGAFSVALPAWWEGKYLCETDSDSILFRCKAAPEDTEGIMLFRIALSNGPDDLEEPGFGGVGIDYEICTVEKDSALRYVTVSEPDEFSGVPADVHDDYMAMLRLTDEIESHLQGENGYTLRLFDYEDLCGVYEYDDDYGRYSLMIESVSRNLLQCELSFHSATVADLIENVTVRMFGNAGVLTWFRESAETKGEWDTGSGVFMVERDADETGYSLMLRAPGDSWTTTDGYLPLERLTLQK